MNFSQIVKNLRDMSTFISMLCLSVNIREPTPTQTLGDIIKEVFGYNKGTIERFLQMTGYIVGVTVAKKANQSETSIKEFTGLRFAEVYNSVNALFAIDIIGDLLYSSLLSDENYGFIKGALQNVIKHWIDKALFANIQKDFDPDETYKFESILDHILMVVLSDSGALKDFWRQDYPQKTNFFNLIVQRYIIEYPEEISEM